MQVLAARRGGREALTEMASQNARLVVGYCAKKAELKRIQEALAAERARWEVPALGLPPCFQDKQLASPDFLHVSWC